MGIEYMLYFYGAVCLSMIMFNVAYAVFLRRSEPRMKRRTQALSLLTDRQLKRLELGKPVEERYLRYLQRKLRHVKNLIAFDHVLRALSSRYSVPGVQSYFAQLQPCILSLSLVYRKRENTQAAYFTYFLSRYMIHKHMPLQSLQEVLLEYMAKDNLYCQVNALQALYTFGSAEYILNALKIQDRGSVFLHEKILTEGLLSFTGDHDCLIELLWQELHSFSPRTQLAILNYIRFRTGSYAEEMFALMEDSKQDKEVRLAAIRYFGRYHYQPALEPLLAFAQNEVATDTLRQETGNIPPAEEQLLPDIPAGGKVRMRPRHRRLLLHDGQEERAAEVQGFQSQ